MKHLFILFFAAIIPVCASCSNPADISIRQYRVQEVRPTSFTSVHGVVILEIDNNGIEWDIQTLSGKLYEKEQLLGSFTAEPLKIPLGISQTTVSADIAIDPGVSLTTILALASNFNEDNYKVSVEATFKQGKSLRTIKKDNIPLKKFVHIR